MVCKPYKEYFILLVVDFNDPKLDLSTALYFKDFLSITHAPELRYLKISHKI